MAAAPRSRSAPRSSKPALRPRDVGYVNLHGTATPKNDEMESRVIARVFGVGDAVRLDEIADRPHARRGGRAGARFVLVAADRRRTAHAACRGTYGTASGIRACRRSTWSARRTSWERDVFVSNSFAFGGSNTTVVDRQSMSDASSIPVHELAAPRSGDDPDRSARGYDARRDPSRSSQVRREQHVLRRHPAFPRGSASSTWRKR